MSTPPRPSPETPPPRQPSVATLIAVLVAIIGGGFAISAIVSSDDDGHGHTSHSVTIRVDDADPGRKADDAMRVPASAVKAAAATDLGDHTDLKTEVPLGVSRAELADAQAQQEGLARSDQLPTVVPDAAPSQAGCRSRFIRYYGSRRGVAPRIIVWHYTVSPNIPGWADVDGVTAFFDRASTQANSNYVLDREGHCNYIVRESDKSWAQVTYNPVSVSIEIINTGREPDLTSGAGQAKLLAVTRAIGKRWNIPMRRGAVSGCTVTRSGIVTHQQLGPCGGGHFDVSPFDNVAGGSSGETASLIASAAASSTGLPGYYTTSERRWIAEYDHLKATNTQRDRRVTLRVAMKAQRQRVYRAGKHDGFGKANRRARYHSLLARTS